MKRIFAYLLTVSILLLSLAGCQTAPPKEEGASLPAEGTSSTDDTEDTSSTGDTVSRPSETISSTHWSEVYYASSADIVTPLVGFCWSEHLEAGEDGKMHGVSADGMGIYEFLLQENLVVPTLYAEDGRITPLLPENATLSGLYLLEELQKDADTVPVAMEELEGLSPGRYYVVTRVEYTHGTGNRSCDEHLFALVVGELPLPENVGTVKLLRYTPDGWGISVKDVSEYAIASELVAALGGLTPTGEIEPKISDDTLTPGGGDYPVDRGTLWVETEDALYRVSRDFDAVCLVETAFGEGRVLELTAEVRRLFFGGWYYAPYDFYTGSYQSGDSRVELKNVFPAPSAVAISVKEVYVEKKFHGENNKVVLELVSPVDQTLHVSYHSYASDDNRGSDGGETVELRAGVPATVECTFYGFNFRYWLAIRAGNTTVELQIDP